MVGNDAEVLLLARHPVAWSRILVRRLRNHRRLRGSLDLAPELLCAHEWDARQALWTRLGPDARVSYLEFGVQRGASLNQASLSNQHPASRFYGFDSFEGIPEDWTPRHRKGAMRADPPALPDPRVELVPGWFAQTVPAFFRSRRDLGGTTVVHVDPDLYSSAVVALTAVLLASDDFYLIIDDCTDEIYDAVVLIGSAFDRDLDVLAWSRGRAGFVKTIVGRVRAHPPAGRRSSSRQSHTDPLQAPDGA